MYTLELIQKLTEKIEKRIQETDQTIVSEKHKKFHEALLRKYFNACDVQIDYARKRILLEVLINPEVLSKQENREEIQIMPMSIGYENLEDFLKEKLIKNPSVYPYYCSLLRVFDYPEKGVMTSTL